MFEILNASLSPSVPMLPIGEPDVFFFNVHGERFVFDANSLCLVRLDEEMEEQLRRVGDQAEVPDREPRQVRHGMRGFLYSRDKPQFRAPRLAPVRRVVLNVTHACNLACRYCFAAERLSASDAAPVDAAPVTMTYQTAMKGVSLIEPNNPLDIGFFGGEPLMAWPLVKEIMAGVSEIARARKVSCKFHITTNGTLLTPDVIADLGKIGCSLLISLDGPREIHDAARPWRSGAARPEKDWIDYRPEAAGTRGSWAAVMEALMNVSHSSLKGRAMARATFNSADCRLVERLEFFAGLHDAGLINGYSVEPAIESESCSKREGAVDRDALAREYHAAAEWFVGRLKAGQSAGFFHFRKFLERLFYAQHAGSECGAGAGYVTVTPDGSLHACHREGTPIGHVEYGFDEELRARWMENRIYKRPACLKCWARYLCGGGCRQACQEIGGNLTAATPDVCWLRHTMFREAMWILSQLPRATVESAIGNRRRPQPQPMKKGA